MQALPLIIAGGTTAGTIFGREKEEKAQSTAIRTEMTQQRLAETQKGLQQTRGLASTLSQAAAQEAARGISLASPSFKAVQQKSFTAYQSDENADALNLMFKQDVLRQQLKQNQLSAEVDIGSSLANLGQFFGEKLDLHRLTSKKDGLPEVK